MAIRPSSREEQQHQNQSDRPRWIGKWANHRVSCKSHGSQGRSTRCIGDGRPPTFNDGNPYFMGPYKALRNWVEFPIPYYMEIMGVDRPDRTWKKDKLHSKKIGVSENRGNYPQIMNFNRVFMGFPLQTIHFGVPLFLETPKFWPRCTTAGKTSRIDCRSTSKDDINAPYIIWG